MADILGKLFGSSARVKMLRLFLFNPGDIYETKEVARRTKTTASTVRREIALLFSIGLVKKKTFYQETERKGDKKRVLTKRKKQGWTLDEKFPHLALLQNFLINATPFKEREILNKFSNVGVVRLLIISGVFIQDWDSRVDILIVGDRLRRQTLEASIKSIEAEIGRELKYTVFTTKDFQYRMSVYDRLVRDILDYPHLTVVDRLGVTQ